MRNELGLFGSEKKTLRELERESEGAMKRKLGPTEGSKVQSCVSNNSCVPGASFLLSLSRARLTGSGKTSTNTVWFASWLLHALCKWFWSNHFSLTGPQGLYL